MIKSKAKKWNSDNNPEWEEPAAEIYPLLKRWQRENFKKVLDLNCGIGRHAILFSKNGFTVDACDLSRAGIEKLNKIIKENNLNITTKISDMLSLPYEDKSFDCLIAFHAIYHTNDIGIKKTIEEIKRVLKDNGEAFITFNSKNSTAFKNPDNKHLSESTIVKTKGGEAEIPHFYADKKEIQELLKDFEIVEFSYKEEYWPDYTGCHYFVLVKKII